MHLFLIGRLSTPNGNHVFLEFLTSISFLKNAFFFHAITCIPLSLARLHFLSFDSVQCCSNLKQEALCHEDEGGPHLFINLCIEEEQRLAKDNKTKYFPLSVLVFIFLAAHYFLF